MSYFGCLLQREIVLSLRRPIQLLQPLILFLFILIIFPLSLPTTMNLQQWASPLLWFSVLFSSMLGFESCWQEEHRDGSLTYFILERQKTLSLIVAKLGSHWFMHGWPLLIILPLIFILYQVPWEFLSAYVITLLPITVIQAGLGVMLSALLVRIRQSQLLLPAILLPLSIPLLILSNAILALAQAHLPYLGLECLLLAFTVFTLTISPLITLTILRFTAEL